MANLLITDTCTRRCPFCFARQRVDSEREGGAKRFISRENVRAVMEFLRRSGVRDLRLLGGEPTLHPEFRDIVSEALAEQFHVHIFTNGMMAAEIADYLGGLPEERLSVLCNVSPQANDTAAQRDKVAYSLERLGPRCQLGVTVTEPDSDMSFVIDLIARHR